MNQQDEDKILNQMYQAANQEQPPEALDELILKHAQSTQRPTKTKSWQPWLAAASVVLVIPMIWLLTQNQQLTKDLASHHLPENQPTEINDAPPKTGTVMNSISVDQEQSPSKATDSQSKPAPSPTMPSAVAQTREAESQQSATDQASKQRSINTNKTLLMNEFKAKKKTIKPGNLDPIMALELQQFNQYLEQGETESAELLLNTMMQDYPDFEFQAMLNQLNSQKSKQ